MTVLSAAQADPDRLNAARERPAASATAAEQPAVTAAAGAGLAFERPAVRSLPAPKASPAPIAQSAGAPITTGPGAGPAPASVPGTGLRAPLSSVNVSSPFGLRVNPLTGASGEWHTGIDLTGPCSTAVFAAGAGTVLEAGWSQYGGGNRIVVDHGNGLKSTYNHLASIGVSVGQVISAGALIAGVGTTGNSTGCHLHFEVMVNGQTVNPAAFI
ncbi:murein DD-endopeptidase MepM/ murein hydrolase activator NlpD [Arthrobacter sp. UYCu512]